MPTILICLLSTVFLLSSNCPAVAINGTEWQNSCLSRIKKAYKGPELVAGQSKLEDQSILIQFTLFPNGSIHWIHEESPTDSIQKKTEETRQIADALKKAISESAPFPIEANVRKDIRHHVYFWYRPAEQQNLDIYVMDYAGFWTYREYDSPKEKEPIPKSIDCVKPLFEKAFNQIPPSKETVFAALWLNINPDGSIDSITPIRCTSEKTKRKVSFPSVKRLQAQMEKAALRVDKAALKRCMEQANHPQGTILIYRSYRKPALSVRPYYYYRDPDAVLLYD